MSYAEKAQTILNAYQALADGGIEDDTFSATMRLTATTAVDAMVHLLGEIGYVAAKDDDGRWMVQG